MWNRKNWFIWFEISKVEGRVFRFPISIYALTSLLGSILELVLVISYLLPNMVMKSSESNKEMTMKDIRLLMQTVTKIMTVLEHQEKFDLVDVETKDVLVKFALR